MSKREKFKRKFQRKVEKLQKKCKHKELDDWAAATSSTYSRPGSKTGFEVKTCKRCGLVVNERTHCRGCNSYVEKKDWVEGGPHGAPFGTFFCSGCFEKYKKENKPWPMPEFAKSKD